MVEQSLRECYRVDAERFGRSRRTAEPRPMREGRTLVGWRMAAATYHPANRQVAADVLGMPALKVGFELGDTGLPEAPVSGGSQTVASVGPAVHASAIAARDKLVAVAVGDSPSPRHDCAPVMLGWMTAG